MNLKTLLNKFNLIYLLYILTIISNIKVTNTLLPMHIINYF